MRFHIILNSRLRDQGHVLRKIIQNAYPYQRRNYDRFANFNGYIVSITR